MEQVQVVEVPKKYKGESWRSYQCRITNNMHLQFPMGWEPYRTSFEKVSYNLGICEELGRADVPYGPFDNSPWPNDPNSELKASKTPREFAEEILEVATSLGINIPEFCKKLNRWYCEERPICYNRADYKELDDYIGINMMKMYVAMRKRGYSHRDLWG
jgi:hypothetical protein